MEIKEGDWVVIDHCGDIWTSKVREVRDGIVFKPETEIHVDEKWYHVSRARKATKGEIDQVKEEE